MIAHKTVPGPRGGQRVLPKSRAVARRAPHAYRPKAGPWLALQPKARTWTAPWLALQPKVYRSAAVSMWKEWEMKATRRTRVALGSGQVARV